LQHMRQLPPGAPGYDGAIESQERPGTYL